MVSAKPPGERKALKSVSRERDMVMYRAGLPADQFAAGRQQCAVIGAGPDRTLDGEPVTVLGILALWIRRAPPQGFIAACSPRLNLDAKKGRRTFLVNRSRALFSRHLWQRHSGLHKVHNCY
jgi:hypothetical protein